MVPVTGAEEDPEVHGGVVGKRRGAVEALRRIELAGGRRIRLTRGRGEEPLARPAGRRTRRDVELPELAAHVTDVHPVDVAVVVQVDRGRVLSEAEVHVLTVVRRAVLVVFPELRAVREVYGEERFAVRVVARRVVSSAEEGDVLVAPADLHLADGGLGPRLCDLRVGEAPHPKGVRGVRDVQGVVEGPAPSHTEDDDRLPRASDFDVRGDRARVHVELVVSSGVGQSLQVVEEVRGDESPELHAIALTERVEHPVVGAGDEHLRPAGLGSLECLVTRVVQRQNGRRHQNRGRMEDVAELPGALFRGVAIPILVVGVDSPDEVDDLVALGTARGAEQGLGNGGVALRERLPGAADDRVDRPVRGRRCAQDLAGFPDQGRGQRDALGVHRDQAAGVPLVGLQVAAPERDGRVGPEGGEIGLRASGRAGRRHDRRGEGESSLDDAADRILKRLLQLGLIVRDVELAAAVLGRGGERRVRRVRLRLRGVDGHSKADRVNDDVLRSRERGRLVVLGEAVRRLRRHRPASGGLHPVRDEDDEVRLALELDRAR